MPRRGSRGSTRAPTRQAPLTITPQTLMALNSLKPKPPRVAPPIQPVKLPATRRILQSWIDAASVSTGLAAIEYQEKMERGEIDPSYRVTVDLWRALDAHQGRLATAAHAVDRVGLTVPPWLLEADAQAEIELAQWYVARGLPGPEVTEDPGEPGAEAAVIDFPRPDPQSARARLVEWLKCRKSPVYFLDNYGHLEHKVRGIIPFRLWPWQAWLLHQWHANSLSITLKARQLGASELAAGYSAWTILFHDAKKVLLLSKGEREAVVLLGRAVVSLDFLPSWMRPSSPDCVAATFRGRSNTTTFEIVHADSDGRAHPSQISSQPATQNAGRSQTAALVILDEWAFQPWATALWTAIKPTADGGGRIIGLSTANGVGNLFHQLWVYATNAIGAAGTSEDLPEAVLAEQKQRYGVFFAAFLSWRRHPERNDAWYAAEKSEKERTNQAHLLHQEYPSEPTSAFVQSGRNVFDATYLMRHAARIEAEKAERKAQGLPPWQAVDGLTLYDEPQDAIVDSDTGKITEARHRYILCADVAEGLPGGDYDCAIVVDRETGLEVACLYGHWPPEEYARRIDTLGRKYFNALVAVERNNHGHAVLLALNSIHRYPDLYHHSDPHIPGRQADRRAGWPTTPTSKPLAIDKLRELLAADHLFPRTMTFLNEALVYAYQENNSMSAPEGYHDDCVAAFWIAAYLLTRPELRSVVMDFVRGRAQQIQQKLPIGPQDTKRPIATPVPVAAPGSGGHATPTHLPQVTQSSASLARQRLEQVTSSSAPKP